MKNIENIVTKCIQNITVQVMCNLAKWMKAETEMRHTCTKQAYTCMPREICEIQGNHN